MSKNEAIVIITIAIVIAIVTGFSIYETTAENIKKEETKQLEIQLQIEQGKNK